MSGNGSVHGEHVDVMAVEITRGSCYALAIASMAVEFVRTKQPDAFRAWLKDSPAWTGAELPDDVSLDYSDAAITRMASAIIDGLDAHEAHEAGEAG